MYDQEIIERAKSLTPEEMYALILYMRILVRENMEGKKNEK